MGAVVAARFIAADLRDLWFVPSCRINDAANRDAHRYKMLHSSTPSVKCQIKRRFQ